MDTNIDPALVQNRPSEASPTIAEEWKYAGDQTWPSQLTSTNGQSKCLSPVARVSCNSKLTNRQNHRRWVVTSTALVQIIPYTLPICQTLRSIRLNMLLPSPNFSLDLYHPTKTLLQDSRSARWNPRLLTSVETLDKFHKPLLMKRHARHPLRRKIHHLAYLHTVKRCHPILVTRSQRCNKASWRPGILQPCTKPSPCRFPMCPYQHPLSVTGPLSSLNLPPYQRLLLLPTQRMLPHYRQMKPWLDQSLMGRNALVHLRSPRQSTKSDLRSNFIPKDIGQMRSQVSHITQWTSS